MDLDKLSMGEKIAGISSIVLFVFMFFDWFTVEIKSGGLGCDRRRRRQRLGRARIHPDHPRDHDRRRAGRSACCGWSDADYEPPVSANAIGRDPRRDLLPPDPLPDRRHPGHERQRRRVLGRRQPRLRHLRRPDRGGRDRLRLLPGDAGRRRQLRRNRRSASAAAARAAAATGPTPATRASRASTSQHGASSPRPAVRASPAIRARAGSTAATTRASRAAPSPRSPRRGGQAPPPPPPPPSGPAQG